MARLRDLARKLKKTAGDVGGAIRSSPHILRGAVYDTIRDRVKAHRAFRKRSNNSNYYKY